MSGDDPPIRVSEETWIQLNRRKRPGETFDDVVSRLLDEVDKEAVSPDQ